MINWLWTKDKEWFKSWDNFNASEPRGHYLQFSDWLFSYYEYGFDVELLIGLENNEICLGFGIVKAKFSLFKFYVVNCGPIVKKGYECYIEESLKLFISKAKKEGACYCHVNLPVLEEGEQQYCLPPDAIGKDSIYFSGNSCTTFPFKYVASINGFSWIKLPSVSEEERLNMFNLNKRRDIRASLRKGTIIVEATSPEQVERAYKACEQNARERGYPLRTWNEFKKYLLPMHEKGYGYFVMAINGNDCKGALFCVRLNNRYHYLIGGNKKEKPDLLIGTFLHWHMIKKSMELQMPMYDNSVGGVVSVRAFKDSFDPDPTKYINGRYWILSSAKYGLYFRLLPWIRKNKSLVAKIIKLFK